MANEAAPFFYRDPAGREDICSTGGEKENEQKREKKRCGFVGVVLIKSVPSPFFPFLRVSKGKETPNFFRLGISLWCVGLSHTIWEEERFDTYCLLFSFLPFSILSFWWKCKFWQERKERRRGCISSISLLCDIIPSAARASLFYQRKMRTQ